MNREVIQYSEAFKVKVVKELETGHLRSLSEASERYGIRGASTVSKWVRKYGRAEIQGRIVRVETTDDRNQIGMLKERIRDLERAVVDSKVQEALHKAYFEIVCRVRSEGPGRLKKNIAEKLSREGMREARSAAV